MRSAGGLQNSVIDILLDRFIAERATEPVRDPSSLAGTIRELATGQHVSPFFLRLVRSVLDTWTASEFSAYRGAGLSMLAGSRIETAGWQDSLALAVAAYRSLGCAQGEAKAEYAWGDRLYFEHEYERALPHFLRSDTLASRTGDPALRCKALIGMANTFAMLPAGFEKSVRALEQAVEIAARHQLHEPLIVCYDSWGCQYYHLNYFRSAASKFRAADSVCTAHGLTGERLYPLKQLAYCHQELGEDRVSDSLFRAAATLAKEIGDSVQLAWIALYRADRAISLADTLGLRAELEMARGVFERRRDSLGLANDLRQLGRLEERSGNLEAATNCLRRAHKLFRDTKDRVYTAKELGLAFLSSGKADSAAHYLWQADHLMDSVRSEVPNSYLRREYLSDKYDLVEGLVRLHLRQGDGAKAFDLAEGSRARSLCESLEERMQRLQLGAEYLSERARTETRMAQVVRRVRSCTASEIEEVTASAQLLAMQDSLVDADLLASVGRTRVRHRAPADHSAFVANVPQGTARLYYFLHKTTIAVWFVHQHKLYWSEISDTENHLTGLIGETLSQLATPPSTVGALDTLNSLLVSLAVLLPDQVKDEIRDGGTLEIFPMGILSYFPFGAIRIGERYLGEVVSIEYYPSLTLKERVGGTAGAKSALSSIAAFGSSFRDTDRYRCPRPAAGFVGEYARLSALEGVTYETAEIDRLFGVRFTSYVDSAHQEEILLELDNPSPDILHFATHGLVFDDYPEFTALVLPLGDDGACDQVLRVGEVSSMSLGAQLVVLSACHSGLGRHVTGEGILGLSQAFMLAGARSLVVTLWSLDDIASAHFFTSPFYRAILAGESTAEAVRQACRAMIGSGGYDHPYFWAPYVAVGNWKR